MKYILVSIKDNAIQAFQPIHTVRASGEALRNFADAINNRENRQLNQHPQDFDLYSVGHFTDDNGTITPHEPQLIVRGLDVIKG